MNKDRIIQILDKLKHLTQKYKYTSFSFDKLSQHVTNNEIRDLIISKLIVPTNPTLKTFSLATERILENFRKRHHEKQTLTLLQEIKNQNENLYQNTNSLTMSLLLTTIVSMTVQIIIVVYVFKNWIL